MSLVIFENLRCVFKLFFLFLVVLISFSFSFHSFFSSQKLYQILNHKFTSMFNINLGLAKVVVAIYMVQSQVMFL